MDFRPTLLWLFICAQSGATFLKCERFPIDCVESVTTLYSRNSSTILNAFIKLLKNEIKKKNSTPKW